MPRVLVHVQNYVFADMLTKTLESGDFNVTIVERVEHLISEFNRVAANLILMEVNEEVTWRVEERLRLCSQMKRLDPDCKVILFVNERENPLAAREVRQAKMNQRIDQFIYSSISASYLLGIMETIY